MSSVLLEARPYRPFKSSEEYLYAMKEDLAEWFQTMYPHLNITADNFMEKLENGVVLCEHANAVKLQAAEYVEKKKAKSYMTRSVTSSLAQARVLREFTDVKYFSPAVSRPGSFYARDNVSNFIDWCRGCLEIMDCLLFETDDLIMRKNEKHVILCLLEVARRGAKFGMLAPVLVQMERQIDREIAADQRRLQDGSQEQNGLDQDTDSDLEDEDTVLMYGPIPQIVTNDLKSLDEMVRDLVEKCTCPTQFPMIRVSEGKYRIGDTKVLIFVRILRNHVMVRVGGGWDTLAHYLDKHDPCRCRSQHRATQSARLINKPGAADLHGSQVYYDRFSTPGVVQTSHGPTATPASSLGPPMNSLNRSRSRSPSQLSYTDYGSRRSASPNPPASGGAGKRLALQQPHHNRSRSPTPNYTSTHHARLKSATGNAGKQNGPQSLPIIPAGGAVNHQQHPQTPRGSTSKSHHVSSLQIGPQPQQKGETVKTEAVLQVNSDQLTDHSDTTSEMSDEGYRSLGVQDKTKQRSSIYSQNSVDDVEENEHRVSDYEETNEIGLRKTQFSQRIYENGDTRKPQEEQTPTPISSPSKTIRKPREHSLTRSNSSERSPDHKTTKPSPPQLKKSDRTGTWNGRSKSARPSLTTDTFQSPFSRNTPNRRSVSAVNYTRRSSSANTSPIKKNNLKDELLETVKHVDDDITLAQQIQDLLKRYVSMEQLGTEDSPSGSFTRQNQERMSFRSPRRDIRTNSISRIPAPVTHKA